MIEVDVTTKDIKDSDVNTEVNINVSSNRLIHFVDLPTLDAVVYGREVEVNILTNFFITNLRHCAVIAPSCFGKTFLIRKFLQNVRDNDEVYNDYFDKIIYFNCREVSSVGSVIDKFKVCLGEGLNEANFFAAIQAEKILCIFDNFESWIDNREFDSLLNGIFTEQQNKLRTIFVSQKMPDDENFLAEELHGVGEKLFQGLDKDAALSFAKTEGKPVNLDKVADESLVGFFADVHYIPQAIRSLIGYLKTKRKTFAQFINDEFTAYESAGERFKGYNLEFRPTIYLTSLQIEALDERSKDLLSVLAFFESEVPELVIEKFKPKVSVIEKEVIHSLLDDWLVEEITIFRGKDFRYYSPHLMIRRVVRDSLPKFEDKHHETFESLAVELFGIAYNNQDRQHNHEEAINLYQCVEKLREYLVYTKGKTELANDLASAYLNKGVSLDSLGKLNEAIIEYDKAIAIQTDLVESGRSELANDLAMAYLNKGVSLYSLGKLNEAIIEYDKAIAIRKDLVESGRSELANALASAYLNKGVSLDSLGKLNEAIIEYDKAIAIRKDLVERGRSELANALASAYLNKGVSLASLGKLNEAIIEFDKAIAIQTDLVESGRTELANALAMAYLNKGVSLRNLGKLNEAIIEYDKAIAIQTDLVESGRTELANDLATAYLNKGVSLASLGKLNEAIIEFDKAIAIQTDLVESGRTELANALAMAYLNKGVSLASLGKLNEAIIEHDKAIAIRKDLVESGRSELASDLAMAYMNKGVSLDSLGKLNEAIIEFDKAIAIRKDLVESGRSELANDLAMAYMNKGVSLDSLGKLNEAIIEYDKAIAILKDLVESGRSELANDLAMAYMNKGVSLRNLGKLNEAIEFYGDAINLWEQMLSKGFAFILPNLAKGLGIRLNTHRQAENTDSAEKDMARLNELLEFTKQNKEIEHLGESVQAEIDERS